MNKGEIYQLIKWESLKRNLFFNLIENKGVDFGYEVSNGKEIAMAVSIPIKWMEILVKE